MNCWTCPRVAAAENLGIGRACLVEFAVRIQTFATVSSTIFGADEILAKNKERMLLLRACIAA
jgi:hypothetical protein